jgi:hypothetical protein
VTALLSVERTTGGPPVRARPTQRRCAPSVLAWRGRAAPLSGYGSSSRCWCWPPRPRLRALQVRAPAARRQRRSRALLCRRRAARHAEPHRVPRGDAPDQPHRRPPTADRRPPTAWRRRPRRLGLLLTTSGLSVLDTSTSGSVHDRTGARRGSVVTVVADFVGAVPGASREGHSGDADAAAFSCMKAEMSATSRRTSTSSSMVVAVAPVTPT